MEIQIVIKAPELSLAINRLADALAYKPVQTAPAQVVPTASANPVAGIPVTENPAAPVQAPMQPPTATTPAPVPQQQPAPAYNPPVAVSQPAPVQQAPTSVPVYQLPDLMRAASDVAGTGPEKRQQVLALINSFGAQAMNQIPPERYGEFAAALRGLGAKL